ncbi:MAG: S24 family peptidase [Tissierellia bacterium]|nr:S24 family peptidase [Tissierellia bacterium]
MNTLGDIIKKYRLANNLSMDDFATLSGLSKSYISILEKNKHPRTGNPITPTLETCYSVAKGMNLDINDILEQIGEQLIKVNVSAKSDEIDLNKIPGIIPLHKSRRIPILGVIACGSPIWAEENIEGYFIIDNIIAADFSLYAKGDSMKDANINDGDLVFLRRTPDVDDGSIAAVLIDNEATLKKVYKTDNELILQPCNSSYKPLVITNEHDVMILGEMVGVYSARNK